MVDENTPTSHRLHGGIVQCGDMIISTSDGSVRISKGNEVDKGREMEIFPFSPIRLMIPIHDPSRVNVGQKSFIFALGDRQLCLFLLKKQKKLMKKVKIDFDGEIVDIGAITENSIRTIWNMKNEVFRVSLRIPIFYQSGQLKMHKLTVDYSDNGSVKKSLEIDVQIDCDGRMKLCVDLSRRQFFGIFEDTVVKSDGSVLRAGEIIKKKKRRVSVVGRELWRGKVLLATENGSIRVVKIDEGEKNNPENRQLTIFSNGQCVEPHSTIRCRDPTTIISTGTSVIVGTKRGEVHCLNEQLQHVRKFETDGGPISCLKLDQNDRNFLLIGYESGELRRVNLLVADENDSPSLEDVEMEISIEEEEEQVMAPPEVSLAAIEEEEEKPTVEDLQKEVAVLQRKLERRERLLTRACRKVADAELLAEYAEEIIEDRMTEEAEKANEKKKMEELEKRLMDVMGENGKLKKENAEIKRFDGIMVKENYYLKQRLKEIKAAQTTTPLAPPISLAEASRTNTPPQQETVESATPLAPPISLTEVSNSTIPPQEDAAETAVQSHLASSISPLEPSHPNIPLQEKIAETTVQSALVPLIPPTEPSHPPMPSRSSDNESTIPTFTAPYPTAKKEEPVLDEAVPHGNVGSIATQPPLVLPISSSEAPHPNIPSHEKTAETTAQSHLVPLITPHGASRPPMPPHSSDNESTVPTLTAPQLTVKNEEPIQHKDVPNGEPVWRRVHLPPPPSLSVFMAAFSTNPVQPSDIKSTISEDRDSAVGDTGVLNGVVVSIEDVDGVPEDANNLMDEEEEMEMAIDQSTVTTKDTFEATVKEKRRRSSIDYCELDRYTETSDVSDEIVCDGEGMKFSVRLTKKTFFGIFEDTVVKSDGSVFRAEEVSEKKKRRVCVVGRELWHGKVLLATENGSIRVVEVEEEGTNKMIDRGQCVEPFNSILRCREPTVIISTMTTVIVGTRRGEIHVLNDHLQLTRKFETDGGPIKYLMLDQSDGVWVEYESAELRRIDLLDSEGAVSGATGKQLKCPVCSYRTRVLTTWMSHLNRVHSTNPYLAGCVLRCECGNESLSAYHSFFCKRGVTVVRDESVPIRTFYDEKTTPRCLLCKKYPKTALGYAHHLAVDHNTTLRANGLFVLCSCGVKVRSNFGDPDHTKKCNGREYTLHKRD